MSNNGSPHWSTALPSVRPLCLLLFAASALCAHGGTVTVQARDAVTNAPLPNVELKLRRSGEPATDWSARTDTQGKAQFEDLSAGGLYLPQIPSASEGRRRMTAANKVSGDNTLKVWDLESGGELRKLEGHSATVAGVAVTRTGGAVSASFDHTLRVWDLVSGRELRTLEGRSATVAGVAVRQAESGREREWP